MSDINPTARARELAEILAEPATTSTRHMEHSERVDGIAQMLADLDALAKKDGCIAAAWVVEFLDERFPKPEATA